IRQAEFKKVGSAEASPVLVLYASDSGTAEKFAKRLSSRATARGLATRCSVMDSVPLSDVSQEKTVLFVTSTAGQGEFPQNGRNMFKAMNSAAYRGEQPLIGIEFAVFGLGDSHYWPRPEDSQYYNKPGKDLNRRLEELGGRRLVDLGLGDDQDA